MHVALGYNWFETSLGYHFERALGQLGHTVTYVGLAGTARAGYDNPPLPEVLARLSQPVDGEVRGHLARIQANAETMAQLIDGLLEFARIGRIEVLRAPVHLDALVRGVVENLAAEHPRAQISVEALPAALGDRALLWRVFDNLASSRVPESGWPPCTASWSGMAAGSGEKGRRAKARASLLRCRALESTIRIQACGNGADNHGWVYLRRMRRGYG